MAQEDSLWTKAARALLGVFVNLSPEDEVEAVGQVVGFDDASETFFVDAAVAVLALTKSELLALRAPTVDPRPRARFAPAAPLSIGAVQWAPGGRAGFDPATREEEVAVWHVNEALPRPLAALRRSVVPNGATVDAQGRSLLPPEARGAVFLTASALAELPTLERWRREAAHYAERSVAAAAAKASGLKPLHSMKAPALRVLLGKRRIHASAGASVSTLASELVRHAERQRGLGLAFCFSCFPLAADRREETLAVASCVFSFLTPQDGCDKQLEHLIKLGRMFALPASYKPPVSLPDLTSYVVGLEVANLQRSAAAAGHYYAPPEGEPLSIIDPDHVLHNWMTKVIHGQGRTDPKSCAVSIVHLIAAAEAVQPQDETIGVVIRVLKGGGDKHSHACSLLVAIHPGLQKSLVDLGHDQDAAVLEAVGLAWRAWKQRGLAMAIRLDYLSRLRLVIYRIIGVNNMTDPTVLRSQHLAGAPTNQWLDLLAGADVFMQVVASLTPEQLATYNASSLTTRGIESGHSHLSSNTCSGEKMTMEQVQGKVRRMDSLHAMMRIENGPYTYQTSSRKRKLDDDTSARWSDGSANFAAFFKDVWKRAKGYVGNRATIRDVNAGYGGQ